MGTVPGIEEYLAEFTSEQAWGEEGYLVDKGMIPFPDDQQADIGAQVKSLSKLELN